MSKENFSLANKEKDESQSVCKWRRGRERWLIMETENAEKGIKVKRSDCKIYIWRVSQSHSSVCLWISEYFHCYKNAIFHKQGKFISLMTSNFVYYWITVLSLSKLENCSTLQDYILNSWKSDKVICKHYS